MTINQAILALFIAIQVLDVYTTKVAFSMGAAEAMPLGAGLFSSIGFWPTIALIKGVGVGLAVAATAYLSNAYWFTGPLTVFGIGVLVNNFRWIARHKK